MYIVWFVYQVIGRLDLLDLKYCQTSSSRCTVSPIVRVMNVYYVHLFYFWYINCIISIFKKSKVTYCVCWKRITGGVCVCVYIYIYIYIYVCISSLVWCIAGIMSCVYDCDSYCLRVCSAVYLRVSQLKFRVLCVLSGFRQLHSLSCVFHILTEAESVFLCFFFSCINAT